MCSLFPYTITVVCEFNINNYSRSSYKTFDVLFPDKIKKAVDKRQAEFLAGRFAAKLAILNSKLKHDKADCIVAIGLNRSPVWPKGICGSITHIEGYAICMASSLDDYESIGIDLEKIIPNELAMDIKETIIDSSELSILNSINMPFNELLTLVFSVKESLFKALYEFVAIYFDFHEAKILGICFESRKVTISLNTCFASKYGVKEKYFCYFHTDREHVLTYLVLPNRLHQGLQQ
jgi:enterobactin synthetase component D